MEGNVDSAVQNGTGSKPFRPNAEMDGGTDEVFCCRINRIVMKATLQPRLVGIESLPTSFETTGGGEKV